MAVPNNVATEILVKCARHCCVCRTYRPLHLQIHHIIEESAGGTNDFDNLIAICMFCHSDVHTLTQLTRRFTLNELKKHRDAVYDLVKNGKLPSSESMNIDEITSIVNAILEDKNLIYNPNKYSEKALKILFASLSGESEIFFYVVQYIGQESSKSDVENIYSIETKEQRFLSTVVHNIGIPVEINELLKDRLIAPIGKHIYKITYKGITYCEEVLQTLHKYTEVKCKCHKCSLHFILLTWYPEKHTKEQLTCPECKASSGNFSIWKQKVFGSIYSSVPGNTK